MGLRESIRTYFEERPRAKKALGVATAIASNFTMIVTGSSILSAVAGTIVDHRQNQEKMDPEKLMDFFKQAIQEPEVQDAIKRAVREGGVDVAAHVSTAMNQLGVHSPGTGQFVSTMKSDLTVIAQELGIIRDLISYYEIPDSRDRVVNVWRLPSYLDDVIVIDDERRSVIDAAIDYIRNGGNVVVLGAPGSGKTTIMYAIWRELEKDTDTALVWDTKDISKVHEHYGVVLFCDDLPETRELGKAIVQKDVRGVVTTAREQEWSRLPMGVRERFNTISLPSISKSIMRRITENHLKSQSVEYDKQAIDAIVSNAQGSPIYVRYMAEEIGSEVRNGDLSKLTTARAMKAPKGMSDYVAGILARLLFDLRGTIYTPKEGALPVIKTLLCLADMPNYETHEVHLNQMFFASKQPSDGPGPFNAIKQYLSRDPRFFSLKFMHDTLADVLRGAVDHPIVGDIRMVAQEMGVAGRKRVEIGALSDGWVHVKEEYDADRVGGLDPLLAYAYFAGKNFGADRVDRIAIGLANEHIESPLSQGLFAIIGPITEMPSSIETAPDKTTSKRTGLSESITQVAPSITSQPSKLPIPDDISQLIRERVGKALGDEAGQEIADKLKGITNLADLAKLDSDSITSTISKYLGSDFQEVIGESKKTSFDTLEDLLKQDSVSATRLSRSLEKAARKASMLSEMGKLKEKNRIGTLLSEGLRRLVLLDSMVYLEILDEASESLARVVGERGCADTLTEITQEIAITHLDEKSKKSVVDVLNKGVKRSEKMGDYEGVIAYIASKWKLLGIDSKDLDYISKQTAELMRLGRSPFAFQFLSDCFALLDPELLENRIGLGLQAFRDMAKASIIDRQEFGEIVQYASRLMKDLIDELKQRKLLVHNPTAAELCITATSSTVLMLDNFVKKSGKSVAAESVYPLLHETIKPLVIQSIDSLKAMELEKETATMSKILERMRGESVHKVEMISSLKNQEM